MSKYIEAKAKAKKVIFAGVSGGVLIFVIGLVSDSKIIAFLGIIAGGSAGVTGKIMQENAKKLRNEDEIYTEKRQELEQAIEKAKKRANQTHRLDYFDIDRNRPDYITFNAWHMNLSDGVTQVSDFQINVKDKIYGERTIKEVSKVTKKKTYYKERKETYLAKVICEIRYNQSIINARMLAKQFNTLVEQYNQRQIRRNSVTNLEHEYNQLLSQKIKISQRTQSSSKAVAQEEPSVEASNTKTREKTKQKDITKIDEGYILNNRYKVTRKIGEGGFGAVFLVQNINSNVQSNFIAKCQKLTNDPSQNEELINRFEQEASVLQRVGNSHGQIPALFDYFDFEGNFYLIQEFIKGQPLMDIAVKMFQEGYVFSERKASEIILSLLEVLECIHEQGLIHRDIKPQNIILREGDGKPVLIDFGLIKQLTEENFLKTGTVAGTMGYFPIEQQMGKALFQSDLYAVGMVMLFLTTGQPPHTLDFNDKFEPDLNWAKEGLKSTLFAWISKAIRPYPQERFGSATEMREDLLEHYNQDYLLRGAELAGQAYENQINSMENELEQLRGELSQQQSSGRTRRKTEYQDEPATPDGKPKQFQGSLPIITTQKEIDAYNILKRILDKAGLDPEQLEMTDLPDHCDIHIRNQPEAVVVRLYFNDEDNLAFAIPNGEGTEEHFEINTLRGISPKKNLILDRFQSLTQTTEKVKEVQSSQSNLQEQSSDSSESDDLLRREILPIIASQIEESFGSEFEIIAFNYDQQSDSFNGQFKGLGQQEGRIFDFEVSANKKGQWSLHYRFNPENWQPQQEPEPGQIDKDNELAEQGTYTVDWLQRNFDSFKVAKEHFSISARSWGKLAEKLNQSSG